MRSTSNRLFCSGDFWDKWLSWFLKILKLPLFYSGNFKVFKNALGQFIPNCPPKYVITSTKFENLIDEKFIDVEQEPVELGWLLLLNIFDDFVSVGS